MPPTFQALIRSGFATAKQFPEPLILLALFCGIVSTILGAPGINRSLEIATLLGDVPKNEEQTVEALNQNVTSNIFWFYLYHITYIFTLALCLVPWVRLFFYERGQVSQGALTKFARRTLRSFAHLIAALGLSIFLSGLIFMSASPLTSSFGLIDGIVAIIAIGFSLWASAALITVALIAVFQEALDLPVGLINMLLRLKDKIPLFAASYITLLLFVNLICISFAQILSMILPTGIGIAVFFSVVGAASFLVSAIFIAGAVKTSLFIDTDA